MPTFVFNDETQTNSYGFRIPNKGISLKRFKDNPVMLDEHWNSNRAVLGKWNNVKVNGAQLVGDSEFDNEDADAKKIAGKVDRGYIKACSMGVTFNRDKMVLQPNGSWELTECELYEVSICAVPSNKNSLILFAETGEVLSEDDVKLSIAALTKEFDLNLNHPKVDKQTLTLTPAALVALNLQNAEDVQAVSLAIERLTKDNVQLKADYGLLEKKVKDQAKLNADALVDPLITDGTLTAQEGAEFKELALEKFEMASKLLSARPKKNTLMSKLKNADGSDADVPKTVDDFEKMPYAKQLAFKNDNPEAYNNLFAAE